MFALVTATIVTSAWATCQETFDIEAICNLAGDKAADLLSSFPSLIPQACDTLDFCEYKDNKCQAKVFCASRSSQDQCEYKLPEKVSLSIPFTGDVDIPVGQTVEDAFGIDTLPYLCLWDTPGVCDAADILPCAIPPSDLTDCFRDELDSFLNPSFEDTLALVSGATTPTEFAIGKMCGCVPDFFACVYQDDCAEELEANKDYCELGFVLLNFGIAAYANQGETIDECFVSCDNDWTTLDQPIKWTVDYTFDSALSDAKLELFKKAILLLNTYLRETWLELTQAGRLTVTIPTGAAVASSEIGFFFNSSMPEDVQAEFGVTAISEPEPVIDASAAMGVSVMVLIACALLW